MAAAPRLISHKLCPYVQRAVIALTEKGVPFERIDIDLANKPDWFLKISPLGKTPVLVVGDKAIFESAVILEYLEETQPNALHPADALDRAEHRGWIEFGSAVLNDIAGFYAAKDEATLKAKAAQLEQKFARLEARVVAAPWFDGEKFSLVDAVFGPVFRYFDVFDEIGDFGILAGKPKLAQWRKNLAARPSVRGAVSADYPALLRDFIERRQSWLSQLQADRRKAA
jgi:glutathione S-transferase